MSEVQLPIYDGLVDPELEEGVYLLPTCHPSAPTYAFAVRGALRIECARCRRAVITLSLVDASEPETDPEAEESW